jgi:hypothetical protein
VTCWVYLGQVNRGDPFTVGFYKPDGEWEPESDHATADAAAKRVHYLNGGIDLTAPLNAYGEGIGEAIQGQHERGLRGIPNP